MTDEEINRRIVEEVMGWTVKESRFGKRLRLHNGSYFFDNLDNYSFPTNISHAFEMENAIEARGLSSKYGDALARIEQEQFSKEEFIHPSMNWLCAHASPKNRCLAALEVCGVEIK